MTKYEKQIYEIIKASENHLTAEQVLWELKQMYPTVSQATVYNNLNKLYAAGLIRRVSVEGMPDRYDRIVKHDHLVCRRCGRLTDVCLEDLTASLKKQLDYEFLSYDLKIFHICPECRKKESEEKAELSKD